MKGRRGWQTNWHRCTKASCSHLCPALHALALVRDSARSSRRCCRIPNPRQQPENARAPPCVGDSFSAVHEVDLNSCLFAKRFSQCASLEERQPFPPKQKEQQDDFPTQLESRVLPSSHGEIASLSAGEKRDCIMQEHSSWLIATGRCPTANYNSSSQIDLFFKKFLY